jgi:ABC-2 type transport system permease protein
MTTMATAHKAGRVPRSDFGQKESFAGTGTLIRFILRRDRIKLPAWILGITLVVLYYGVVLQQLYQTPEDLQSVGQFGRGVMGALISGPGFGLANPTLELVIVGVYGLYLMLLAALMNILLVSRHTRVEEQTGRAELVRADVVGRHAPLSATLIVAASANIVLSVLLAGAMAAAGLDTSDGLLFGASVGAAGLVFAGVTAVTVQVTEFSRAAAGLAGAALGAAYVVRAAGDMLREGGSPLSWFSPLAWSQQTSPYADGRWWPLLLSVGFFVTAAAVGYALSARRDLGAGLIAPRHGNREAPAWLNSPVAVAFRLQRSALGWWAFALALAGVVYGAIAQPLVDAFEDMPEQMVQVMGGDPARMLDGYLATMALFDALIVVIFVILGVQSLRGEETTGRVEPVLGTATGRVAWMGGYLMVLAAGAAALLGVVGVALGVASAMSVGDVGYVWTILGGHLAFVPAVWVVLAVAACLYGVLPRAVGAVWALFGFAMIIGTFGPLMDLPSWVADLSPFEHIARLPMDTLAWTPLIVLTLVALAVSAIGLAGFRHRDLETT